MEIQDLLAYTQRTNPGITEEKLMEELKVSRYSTIGLILAFQNSKVKEQ